MITEIKVWLQVFLSYVHVIQYISKIEINCKILVLQLFQNTNDLFKKNSDKTF